MQFDNRWSLSRGDLHLTFELGDRRIAYAYIRKNGCSTFKRALGFAKPADIREVAPLFPYSPRHDLAVFVYRDPVNRIVSLYRNKVLEQRGADDLFADYRSVMGEEPSTFERFAQYVPHARDPHCWPQRSCLKRLRYHAIPLERLHAEMCLLVGAQAAEPFRRKANASHTMEVEVTPLARSVIERHYAGDYRMIRSLRPTVEPRRFQPAVHCAF